jgi:hypothetical protein
MPLEIIDEIRPRKQERATLREIVMAVYNAIGILCLLFLFALAATWPTNANADPIYRATADGIVITLTNEDCKLPAVSNLKKRATWTEKGKTFEGCWGGHPAFPIVMGYFADKTVVVLPVEAFAPVTGV